MQTSVIPLVLALLTVVSPARWTEAAESRRRPNVLFIAVDDLNNWVTGLSDYGGARTPNIDRLATRGVLFTNAHCAAPASNPSRVSLLTGVAPSTSGVYLNKQDWRACENLKGLATLPAHFRAHGYEVRGGGKIYHAHTLSEAGHAGFLDAKPWDEYFPSRTRQLPDELKPDRFPANGSSRFYRGYFDWAPLGVDYGEMADSRVVAWAERHLSVEHDRPLFLAVGIYRPHVPWYTPGKWFEEFPIDDIELPRVQEDDLEDVPEAGKRLARRPWQAWLVENEKWKPAVQAYLASTAFADAMVGRLLKALDDGPLADDTIVVLWSDHGYHLGHKEHWEKFTLWEQATQVPLVFVDTGEQARAGAKCREPVSLLDVYPTLIDLCGLSTLDHLDGRSLVPLLREPKTETDRFVVTTHGFGNHAIRSRRWRYIRYRDGSEELYEHGSDPHEFANLAKDPRFGAVKRRHATNLPEMDAATSPPLPRPAR